MSRAPMYIGMLAHINDAQLRQNGNIVVFYHTILGKDDSRESMWTADKSNTNYSFMTKLVAGNDYYFKMAVKDNFMTFISAYKVDLKDFLKGSVV